MLQKTDSHLIDPVVGQVSLQAIQVFDFGAIGKVGASLPAGRFLPQAAGVGKSLIAPSNTNS